MWQPFPAHVPEDAHPQGLQVLCGIDHARPRTRHHRRRRSERFRQVEHRRCRGVGARRARGPHDPLQQDGRRHLRGHIEEGRARAGRGVAHDRQLERASADRVRGGHDHQDAVPQRRERVRHQRRRVSTARHPGAALGYGCRSPAARHRQPGPVGGDPRLPTGGPSGGDRGGGRHPQVPQAARAGTAPSRSHRVELRTPWRPAPRDPPPAPAARASGGVGPQARGDDGRAAGHPAASRGARAGRPPDAFRDEHAGEDRARRP